MELLDRYLEAVRKQLPWQRQDDIIAELRANLEAQLEEKEEALGRPLSHAEAEAWIKSLSAPMQMASPYQAQQYLIGPALFPFYRNVLRIALTWAIIVYSIATAALLLVKTPGLNGLVKSLMGALLNAPGTLFITAAWVTLIFAVVEYTVARGYVKLPPECGPLTEWSAQMLPPFEDHQLRGKKRPSFAKAVADVIFGAIFLIWLLLLPRHPFLWLGPGFYYVNSLPYELAPVWIQFFWACVAVNIIQLGWGTQNLFRGRWQRPQRAFHLAMKAAGLIPMVFLLLAPGQAIVLLKNPAADGARYAANLNTINRSVYLGIEIVCAIVTVQLLWGIVQFVLDGNRKRAAAMQ